MKIRALIVDDEPRARRRMRRLLAEHPDVEVIGEAGDGDGAVAAVLSQRPSVVFLDVNMPVRSGTDAVRLIHGTVPEGMRPMVILTTAHEEHAVEAFALNVTDYLLKPVERARLGEALRRVRKAVWSRPPASAAPAEPEPAVEHLSGVRGGRIVPVELDDVAAITVDDTLPFAHLPSGRLRLRGTLAEVEQKLPPDRFVRVSRSAIVQLDWIEALKPRDSGTWLATLRQPVGLEVQVSRRRARRLRDLLDF